MRISQIFQDPEGKMSNVRVMSFLCLIYGFYINTYALMGLGTLKPEIFYACLVAAFAPKVVQKFAERVAPGAGGNVPGQGNKETAP